MSAQRFKFLYTGVWGSGYIRVQETFSRVSIKNITFTVDTSNRFRLRAKTIITEDHYAMDAFCLQGNAQFLYEDNGRVREILVSNIACNGNMLECDRIFTISQHRVTRLPIPYGEAFFCFSSKLPEMALDFQDIGLPAVKETKSEELSFLDDEDVPALDTLPDSFYDEIFNTMQN